MKPTRPWMDSPWFDCLWVAFWGIISSALIVAASARLGATYDEPVYLKHGLEHWRTGSTYHLMRLGTMPLAVDVQTFPVFIAEVVRGSPFDLEPDMSRPLAIARMGNLAFWWLLLILGWRVGRSLGGTWAGRLAVAALACEPNLQAHAGLATTDLSITACLLLFAETYRAGRGQAWPRRVLLPCLTYGIAILAKASAIAFVPLCIAAIELQNAFAHRERSSLRTAFDALMNRRQVIDFAQMATLALVLVFVYCGSDWQPNPWFVAQAKSLPAGAKRDALLWVAENLRIYQNAGVALVRQTHHNMQGHGVYLLGDTHPRAFWYYFPVALTIKFTLVFFGMLLGVLVFRPRGLATWVGLASVALSVFTLNCRVQIGIRLVLPLVAFATIAVSSAFGQMLAERPRIGCVVGSATVLWMASIPALAWPHAIGYANALWGGSENCAQLLSDSNCDWGQGIPELRMLCERQAIETMALAYFGADPAAARPPFHRVGLHAVGGRTVDELRSSLPCPYLAVSATLLHGAYLTPETCHILTELRTMRPAFRTSTFWVFDLSGIDKVARKP